MSGRVRIAVDAVGGDFAPGEILAGAIRAARAGGVEIILVGPRERVETELREHDAGDLPVRVVDAGEAIGETERPGRALVSRPDASVGVAARLVGGGEADALVGAGNSGAFLISSARYVGCVEGVSRAVVGTSFPFAPHRFLLDAGVNIDCKPEHLLGFATLGVAYARTVLGIESPRVGLLSVGAEETKGPAQVRQAHQLLERSRLDFIGNVEGSDLFDGEADVTVCDGMVGNALLKLTEGYSRLLLGELDRGFAEAGMEIPPQLNATHRRLEESTDLTSGGQAGTLLGMNRVCMLCHGRSRAGDFQESVEKTRLAVERGLVEEVSRELRRVRSSLDMDVRVS